MVSSCFSTGQTGPSLLFGKISLYELTLVRAGISRARRRTSAGPEFPLCIAGGGRTIPPVPIGTTLGRMDRRGVPADNLLPGTVVDECLSLYPPDERHLSELSYVVGCVCGTVEPHGITYSTITVPYYTASQLLLLTSQMAYILAGAVILDQNFPFPPSSFYATYMRRLLSGETYYSTVRLHFRSKVPNTHRCSISIRANRIHRIAGLLAMSSTLTLAEGAASADARLLVPGES
jgi:hypothetical protein